jgi:hypothetical protein
LSPVDSPWLPENPVYVQGDYNSNAADPAWGGGADLPGHAAAAAIADSVTLLSNNWSDLNSFVNPTAVPPSTINRIAATTYYRLAVAGGKNMDFPKPAFGGNDYGTDGGTHNFLRYLENWGGGKALNYKGSLVSLYYSTYLTGVSGAVTRSIRRPLVTTALTRIRAAMESATGTPLFRTWTPGVSPSLYYPGLLTIHSSNESPDPSRIGALFFNQRTQFREPLREPKLRPCVSRRSANLARGCGGFSSLFGRLQALPERLPPDR